MKAKINEIPLVGPRGRKELIKKINNLEKSNSDSSSNSVINVPGVFSEGRFVPELGTSGNLTDTSKEAALWSETANAFKNGATINLVVDNNYYRVVSLEYIDAGGGVTVQTLNVCGVYLAMTAESQSPVGGWINPDSTPSSTPSDPAH